MIKKLALATVCETGLTTPALADSAQTATAPVRRPHPYKKLRSLRPASQARLILSRHIWLTQHGRLPYLYNKLQTA